MKVTLKTYQVKMTQYSLHSDESDLECGSFQNQREPYKPDLNLGKEDFYAAKFEINETKVIMHYVGKILDAYITFIEIT